MRHNKRPDLPSSTGIDKSTNTTLPINVEYDQIRATFRQADKQLTQSGPLTRKCGRLPIRQRLRKNHNPAIS